MSGLERNNWTSERKVERKLISKYHILLLVLLFFNITITFYYFNVSNIGILHWMEQEHLFVLTAEQTPEIGKFIKIRGWGTIFRYSCRNQTTVTTWTDYVTFIPTTEAFCLGIEDRGSNGTEHMVLVLQGHNKLYTSKRTGQTINRYKIRAGQDIRNVNTT